MKKFRFTANVIFDAENIDDACKQLEDHFKALPQGEDIPPWFIGEMHIEPVLNIAGRTNGKLLVS